MAFSEKIQKLRIDAHLSQEQLAEILGVSRQSVQKWEKGSATPELDKLIRIARHFDISLDELILDRTMRDAQDMRQRKVLRPQYGHLHDWESYSSDLMTEYQQSTEEGLDLRAYAELFKAVSLLPKDETKKKLGDILFDVVLNAPAHPDYPYLEPSTLPEIQTLRKSNVVLPAFQPHRLPDQVLGAWQGRICGCLLGKTVEGVRTNELIPFLKETDNYPMHRYILKKDLKEENLEKYGYPFAHRCYADDIDGMPVDDDTNYMVLAQEIIEKYGRDFTAHDVSRAWLDLQPKDAYCTAERVAFCNFVKGYEPPQSALYKNPYREWIGAQIRGDYFGYINPGNPALAAEMAFRDASISHVKNGIYGEMLIAAMIAAAACTTDIKTIIQAGLAQIPHTSRLHEAIQNILIKYDAGASQQECFQYIHSCWDEYTGHGWCHTISNAMIVAASLLYGRGDYSASICMAVETGFDTDCNGATVGSILGMAYGTRCIGPEWTTPIGDKLNTSIFGVGAVKISERAALTMKHMEK
ncbi:MAG: helix-turn-helix domain-containing protein [Clostridiales bacterium]|nr:helix-turn-helix domain-containing protein [Clostridiales bacterium]